MTNRNQYVILILSNERNANMNKPLIFCLEDVDLSAEEMAELSRKIFEMHRSETNNILILGKNDLYKMSCKLVCSKCDKEIEPNKMFCGNCGEAIFNKESIKLNKEGEEVRDYTPDMGELNDKIDALFKRNNQLESKFDNVMVQLEGINSLINKVKKKLRKNKISVEEGVK